MKKTVAIEKISDSFIKKIMKGSDYSRINVINTPFWLKISSCRTKAYWYFLSFKKNEKVTKKIGTFPFFSTSFIKNNSDKLLQKHLKNEVITLNKFHKISDLLLWYLDRVLKDIYLSSDRKKSITIAIKSHLIKILGDFSVDEITIHKLDEVFMQNQIDSQISSVRLRFSILKSAFKLAAKLHYLEKNYIENIKFSDLSDKKILARHSRLKQSDINEIAENIRNEVNIDAKFFNLMLLAHATRLTETACVTWDCVDFDNKIITYKKTKTKQILELPLTDFMLKNLKRYKKWQQKITKTNFLFPNSSKKTHISSDKAAYYVKKVSKNKWSAHDYRKLVRSRLMNLGNDYIFCEMILNHALSKLDKAYIQEISNEKILNALEKWHNEIQSIAISDFMKK